VKCCITKLVLIFGLRIAYRPDQESEYCLVCFTDQIFESEYAIYRPDIRI
jgi:hypothetical protein